MSSINELICDELIYWKFEISSTAQSKNQLNWASCGLDQSIETIQSMGSINNQSTDRYSRWGPPACSNVLAGWASLILPACGPPTALPARPVNGLSLPSFLCCLFGGQVCRPNPIFSHIESAHSQLKKSALTHSAHLWASSARRRLIFCKRPSFFCLEPFKEATAR